MLDVVRNCQYTCSKRLFRNCGIVFLQGGVLSMLPIPYEILRLFDTLLEKKSVPQRLRPDYRKWLRYFLDFRAKYQTPDSRSEQVRQFIDKLRSKGQSSQQMNEAAQAVSLYFATQTKALPAASIHSPRISCEDLAGSGGEGAAL